MRGPGGMPGAGRFAVVKADPADQAPLPQLDAGRTRHQYEAATFRGALTRQALDVSPSCSWTTFSNFGSVASSRSYSELPAASAQSRVGELTTLVAPSAGERSDGVAGDRQTVGSSTNSPSRVSETATSPLA